MSGPLGREPAAKQELLEVLQEQTATKRKAKAARARYLGFGDPSVGSGLPGVELK